MHFISPAAHSRASDIHLSPPPSPAVNRIDRHLSPLPPIRSAVVARLQQSELFREYQQAFETTMGLPLVLREAGSFRTPLQDSKQVNPFCALLTQTNKTCAACLQLQQRVEEEAIHEAKTIQCFAGLSETAVPVRVGDHVLGYLQTGQVFFKAPSRKKIKEIIRLTHAQDNGRAARELESAYFQTRIIASKQYDAIIRLLRIFAAHLATVSNQLLLAEATVESPQIAKARTYIAAHQSEELGLKDVARAVNMSAFYFCKFFRQATGLTFTHYLARARIESVKTLLLNSHIRISEAAYAAGFQSLSQFNRVFRRLVGETPSAYFMRQHGLNRKASRPAFLVHAA